MMKRREMLKATALAGVAAGLGPLGVTAAAADRRPNDGREGAGCLESSRRHRDEKRLIVSGLDVSTLDERYVGMLKAGGVECWHKSIGGIAESIGDVYRFADDHPDDVVVATSVAEIRQAYRDGRISIVFGNQSAESYEPYLPDLRSALRGFYQLGLRILGIAYNLPNAFGSGNFYPYMGLSNAGRHLVEEIHNLNMILDVGGHTGEQTSIDAIAMSPGVPVICSHTNVAAIADNPRCVSDRLIEAIADTGGVVGLTAVNDFHVRGRGQLDVPHSPRATVEAYLDQIEYIRDLVGVEHVGIGPDFVEGRGIDYDLYNRTTSINRAIISDGEWLYVEGFENISELPNVVAGLEVRSWSEEDIDKVMGENWLRVYERVWGS